MNFKQLLTITITFFLFSSLAINNSFGQGGETFRSNRVTYVEDSIYQFSINVLYDTLNQLSNDFELLKTSAKADEDTSEKFKATARINAQAIFGTEDLSEVPKYNVAGYCFIPIKKTIPASTGDSVHFYTEGFYAVLTIWKSSGLSNFPQPEEALLFLNGTTYTVEDGLAEIERTTPLNGVRILREGSSSPNGIVTSKFIEADSIVFNTREFELVFLDMQTFRDLATNARFYGNQAVQRPNGKGGFYLERPGGKQGIVIERSFLSLNPITSSTFSNPPIPIFAFQNYRSLIFKPYPIPDLQSSYDAESAFAFSHGFGCPPYWRPDDDDPPPGGTSSILIDDKPDMLRFFRSPPPPSDTLSLSLLGIANRVQFSGLVQPEVEKEEASFWDKKLNRILLSILAFLGLLMIILIILILIGRTPGFLSND